MQLKLHIWRQASPESQGSFEYFEPRGLDADMSVPEMLDQLNESLIKEGRRPVAFESDCREGICGQCGFVINGEVHSPEPATTTCQTHLRSFRDGATLYLEPFRSRGFPIKRDLMLDRSALDRIIAAGGYVGVNTGQAPEANSIPVAHERAEAAFDAAACIGCGGCVAACPNASAALFTGAKVSQLALLPQGLPEANRRVKAMVQQMDLEAFGTCSHIGACTEVCPQGIGLEHIVRMNGEYRRALGF